ncbi:restriction endonuclease [Geodermatophilus obscurus]|uniref:Restriction endonuclease n=1 Tax=Geodermatophilus obscurus (strain ATCC 25078 / DSM 43160 / JCM 3152 / CCUG 61914 / KCC A-0152 / KCTC 9177 / NBRC 13315 / NRRL B-3577 / G-20) TaxID=526225 RepID=D2SC63_GEOOG|nr:restriction endonuclease [Geodermatophilus obscurus]ADB74231.1 restriction endonuclease [Geodermatophilus obscurus DSM 43160]
MAVPPFHRYLDPVLRATSDGNEHRVADLAAEAASVLGLTSDDMREVTPSAKRSRNLDRTYWAVTYLFQAGLLERPGRGAARISQRGADVLRSGAGPVSLDTLRQFDEFLEFKGRKREAGGDSTDNGSKVDDTLSESSPVDAMQALVDRANGSVAAELLARIVAQPPDFLERVVLKLLSALGYGGLQATTEHLGGPGDEGLDGVIRQDALGLDVVYVQAKRYAVDRKVGRPDIQAFVGALTGAQANRGVFITTSSFTPDARAYADRVGMRLVLIDGRELSRLMVDRNVGVSIEETYHLKRIDEDFFEA